jgi:hypothetical protein
MAESLKTILMSALASKATPAESDTLIVGEGNVLKKYRSHNYLHT